MKKLSALSCALVLVTALLGGCAVTPEPSESAPDTATTATTEATAATTTASTAATTVPVTTTTASVPITATATTTVRIIADPYIHWETLTDNDYAGWARGMANDAELLSRTFYRSSYSSYRQTVNYYHEQWLTDRAVWQPALPEDWVCEEIVAFSGGRTAFTFQNRDGKEITVWINAYRGDERDRTPENQYDGQVRYWSTLNGEPAAREKGYPVKTLTLKDGTPCKFTEYQFWGAFGEIDGYMWRMYVGNYISSESTDGIERLVRNLSFEKIEL